MDDTGQSKRSLRKALSRQWQLPLLLASLACFTVVLIQLRPRTEEVGFVERLAGLESLAQQQRYEEFYQTAELLRQEAQTQQERGQVHLLAAQTRAGQLRQDRKLGVTEGGEGLAAGTDYENLISDYEAAFKAGLLADAGPERTAAYRDLGHAYWGLGNTDKAIKAMQLASEEEGFSPVLHRELVTMELRARQSGYLDRSLELLEQMLAAEKSSADDRGWAFVRKAEVLIAQGHESEALAQLEGAGPELRGTAFGEEIDLLRGRALRQAGRVDEAEGLLRDLLGRMRDRGDLYAQAALELGWINHDQYRDHDALRFYQLVVESQLGKDWYAAGKLGLAEVAALQQRYAEAAELYQETVDLLQGGWGNRAVSLEQVQRSLATVSGDLVLRRSYELALGFMEIEQQITDDLHAILRYARTLASRAEQLLGEVRTAEADAADTAATEQEKAWVAQQRDRIIELFAEAGRQFLRAADSVMGADDLYGDTLWQAATCFDKAAANEEAIETWTRFVNEREGKPAWPRALFQLAQAYQAVGDVEHAIDYYETLHRTHPKSLAAFDAMVPLAQCYLQQEPAQTDKARALLEGVLADAALTPRSVHFREALFSLGELHYQEGAYAKAISQLTQGIERYPEDKRLGKFLFLVADSYRRSGVALDEALAQLGDDPTARVNRQRLHEQRSEYLDRAGEYFGRAIEFYDAMPEGRRGRLDELYLRHCWLYRADCLFDLGRYREAAQLYEMAALRYQLTPTALSAFAQIVNCQLKMDQAKEARATAQRAKWQLREMADEAFTPSPTALSRQEWASWFDWLGQSNLW